MNNSIERTAPKSSSISTRLLVWSFSALLIAGILTAAQLAIGIRKEMRELIDANLMQYASSLYMLEQQVQGYDHVSEPLKLDDDDDEDKGDDGDHKKITPSVTEGKSKVSSEFYSGYAVAFQIWDLPSARLIIRSAGAPEAALTSFEQGFSNQTVGDKQWRTYVHIDRERQHVIMVAQEQLLTQHLIREIVMRLVSPMALSFLLLLGVFYALIRRSLRPLAALNHAIAQRSPIDLQPIQLDKAPTEITPVVQSINALMHSLEESLNKERHFTGNAAHELRTPLSVIDTLTQTAIKTQDLSLLPKIKNATEHARRQIEQLLTLARLDANAGLSQVASINLYQCAQTVIADLYNIRKKNVTMRLLGDTDTTINSTHELMYILLKNIIENAIAHSPEALANDLNDTNDSGESDQGVIQVQVFNSPTAHIQILDSGSGIAPEQLQRITERFYRAEQKHDGFGIGLSIVQRISQLHEAQLTISNRDDGHSGLSVLIRFPK